jgi:hypothetical protein
MAKNLISRVELARRAGVAPSSVTKACAGSLKNCCTGKRVDADHPDVVAYIARRERATRAPELQGIDPLYEEAVDILRACQRPTQTALRKPLNIGDKRAATLFGLVKATGILDAPEPDPEPEPVATPATRANPRGWAARRETRKRETPIPHDDQIFAVPEDIQAFADMTLRELVEKFGTDIRFLDWLKATKSIEDINEKRLKNAETKGELVSRQLVRHGILDPIESAHVKLLTDGAKTIARRATAMHGSGRDMEDIEKFVADQITSFLRPMKAKIARTLKNA